MCLVNVYNSTCVTTLWFILSGKMKLTTICEDNSALFIQKGDIKIQKICSCENLTNLFTKSLPSRISQD